MYRGEPTRCPSDLRLLPRARCSPALALCCAVTLSGFASAQGPAIHPGDERPALPRFPAETRPGPTLDLPPVPDFEAPPPPPGSQLPPAPALPVEPGAPGEPVRDRAPPLLREVRVEGVTALDADDVDAIVRPFLDRPLDFASLARLRDALTNAYVERGFVTSGVVVPRQVVVDGVLTLRAVEGRVTDIAVATDGRLRASYVEQRLAIATGPPVDVRALERALQILQDDERIRGLAAQLVPGARRGEATLHVRVREATPFHVRLAADNYSSPAIGSARGVLAAGWNDVTGFGDGLRAEYRGGEGLQDVQAEWRWPLSPWDTTLGVRFRRTWSEVVEDPFAALGVEIESRTESYGFELSQPVYRTRSWRVNAFAIGEWRRSESKLFGRRFSFVAGPRDGVAKLALMRFGADATWRARDHVVAARAQYTRGFPWLGATRNGAHGVPDAKFGAFLGQIQWAGRFPDWLGLEVVARADLQLADGPLFSLEQFAMGGHATVRGYRENRLVRDSGAIGSVELRLPIALPALPIGGEWSPSLQLATFFDVGHSWNSDRPEYGDQTLMSVGVGGRFGLLDGLDLNVYWGHDLKHVTDAGDDLQDDGLHMGAVWSWP